MGYIDEILQDARQYIGQEEIRPNLGFKDPVFDAKMRGAGFYRTASWCGFFVIMVMKEVYAGAMWASIGKYFSASTHQMWLDFKAAPMIKTSQVPKLGAVAVWQEGSGTNGHTGIVSWISDDLKSFKSIEGNTNGAGGREGYRVWENLHKVGLPHNEKGLNLCGFGYMPE